LDGKEKYSTALFDEMNFFLDQSLDGYDDDGTSPYDEYLQEFSDIGPYRYYVRIVTPSDLISTTFPDEYATVTMKLGQVKTIDFGVN
jgi:hypothetical protein